MDALIDLALVSRMLGRALARGGDYAEVYVQRRLSKSLSFDDGEIRDAAVGREFGVGVRVLRGTQQSYAWSDDTSLAALLDTADAASMIDGGNGVQLARPLAKVRRPNHSHPQRTLAEHELEPCAEWLRRADAAARDGAVRLKASLQNVSASFVDVLEDILIASSDGLLVDDHRNLSRLNVEVIVNDAGRRKTGSGGGGSRTGPDHFVNVLTPEQAAHEAMRMAHAQCGAGAAPVGSGVVVLAPASSGVLLHEAVGHGLEADFIRKRQSLFTGKLGEKVASDLVTVIDDGTLPGRRGSLHIDDEGTATTRTTLIERGELRGYLTDKHNADLLGMERTGNGRRQSFRHAPMPRMTNTFLAPGKDAPQDILRSVKHGVYCRAFGGGQVDIANGSFVFQVREGYLIENGEITTPVEGATLVGNGPDVLLRITAVGHDGDLDPGVYTCGKAGQSVPVCVGLPTVRIDGITIGGSGARS